MTRRTPEYCPESDQVGTARPQGGGCDIGAIESRRAVAPEPTPIPPLVCSLADQIVAANRDWPAGGCPGGSGGDVISLDKDITLFAALPAITSNIVIEGNGHTISGSGRYRIFDVDGGILTIRNLTMTEGYAAQDGGAIRLQNDGKVFVSDSRFYKNSAGGVGAAIFIGWQGVYNSRVSVRRSSFVENIAWGISGGGGIYAGGGSVSVSESSFVRNSSYALAATNFIRLDVVNTSFIANGGTLKADNGVSANFTHVTICCSNALPIRLPHDDHLSASKLNLRNSIIWSRRLSFSALCDVLKENISNLIQGGACSARYSGDPMLEKVSGTPEYLGPLPGSPAIGAADKRFCPETDQTGRARPTIGRCDIGAIQAVPVPQAVSSCAVTTTHVLNLRDGPSGKVIGGVPDGATLTVIAMTPRLVRGETWRRVRLD